MPKLLNISSYCENLPEVTSSEFMNKKKFNPNGLFSEQIFGPLKNYTCQCGIYYGPSSSTKKCEKCKVDIVHSGERRKRFAKIILPFGVVNPLFYDLLVKIGGTTLKKPLDDLMRNDDVSLYKDGDDYIIEKDSKIAEGTQKWEKTEAIYELIRGLSEQLSNEGIDSWKMVSENLDNLIIRNIIVLPPDLRPPAKGIERNNQVVDKVNRYYTQILIKKATFRNSGIDIHNNKNLYYNSYKQLQKDVNELYEHIIEKLSKKEGLIRGNILGKRIDFSGRGVIVPEPSLNIDECSLPYIMVLELFKLQISKKLIELRKFKLLNEAIDFVEKCIEFTIPALKTIAEEVCDGEYCLLNRQPSLHRLSMIGFKIKMNMDNVIRIHPLVCSGFNADFDGDQMAVYLPISKPTKDEVKNKFISVRNLTNPANGSLATIPSQDIILGIYALTSNKISSLKNEVLFKGKKISEGQKIFNECFPEDFPLIDKTVIKKDLINLLNEVKDNYSDDITAEVLDNVKKIGFKYSTYFGTTISIDELNIPGVDEFRSKIYNKLDPIEQLVTLLGDETKEYLKKNFKYSYLIDSGARGSWDQARQIVFSRGYISNFQGEIIPTPIKGSLIDGLTQEEFFNSTWGCRKGLLDVAVNTGDSGYLSRKLIFGCANLIISSDLADCGTNDLLDVFVKNDKKAKMLIGRWYKNEENNLSLITKDNYKKFVGKLISIRSPLLCNSDAICQKCYGELYKDLHSRFIGIIAAQAAGESGTQLILRTFHSSGVASIGKNDEEVDLKQKDIVGDLSTASKLLHSHGDKNYTELVSDLYDVYNTNRDIHHVHFECIVSQLMWFGYTKWRLLSDRHKHEPEFISIQSVPERESWIMGVGFSNPKAHLLKSLVSKGHYKGIYDRIMLGEKL